MHIRESVDSLCRDGADTASLNKCNGSELSNATPISPFRHITWPTSVSIHDNTLKIHCYNTTREIAKTPISSSSFSSSSNSSNSLAQNWYKYLP